MRRFLFALVVLVVGCDPVVDKHTPDAAKGIDAAPDAPTHGIVSVKVYDPNNTQAVVVGVPVVFIEADGTVVGHPTTGSDGIAMADVHRNATATVVITTQGSTQMQTVTGLLPGDVIVLGPNTPPQTTDGTFAVSFPTYGGASNYSVYGPCGLSNSTTSPVTLTLYSDCKQATMDLQVIAYDANANPLVYIDKPNVAYTAGGTTAISGSYVGLSTFTGTYTNVDASLSSINMSRSVPDGYGFSRGTGGTPASGMLSLTAIGPQAASATISSRVLKGRNQSEVDQKIAGNALTYGLDVGASILPFIGQPTFDVATRKLTVPVDTVGTSMDMPDVFYVDVSYSRTVGTTTSSFAWLIFAAAPADITLPALPAEIGDVMPKMTDTINGTFAAMLESDTLTSYDGARVDLYTAITGMLDAPHPAATRIRFSTASGGT